MLGDCDATIMEAAYTKRHDDAVRAICHGVLAGDLAQGLIYMDAGKSTCLPKGVMSKRIPNWLLPGVNMKAYRPDLLLIPTMTKTEVRTPGWTAPSTAQQRQAHKVIIVEVGYTNDRHDGQYHDKMRDKLQQHEDLKTKLMAAGWTVKYSTEHIYTIGHTGTMRAQTRENLENLGIDRSHAEAIMHDLHNNSIRHMASIMALRRELDHAATHPP